MSGVLVLHVPGQGDGGAPRPGSPSHQVNTCAHCTTCAPIHLYTFTPVHLCREAGGLYKLIIRQLSYRELTNFTCRAENEVGYNNGVIEVTGNQDNLA